MVNIDLNQDNMKEVFENVIETLKTQETKPVVFEGTELPLVTERNNSMIYYKIKDSVPLSYEIGATSETGAELSIDSNLAAQVDA